MKTWCYIFVALFALTGCKKDELPENFEDTPEFYISGEIGGTIIDVTAGDNNYYLYSSFDNEEVAVPKFIAELKTEGCEKNCPESFTLIFTNENETPEGLSGEPALRTGSKPFTNPNAGNEYEVDFNPEESFTSKALKVDYFWDFGDGTTSEEKSPNHVYKGNKDFYDVTLMVKTSKGCDSEIKNRVFTKSNLKTDFVITQNQQSISLQPELEDIVPNRYLWEFEDGSTSSVPFVDIETDPRKGIEQVCLTVTDKEGRKSQRCKNLILKQEYTFCAANYAFESASRVDPNGDLQLGTVYLKYTNVMGKEFFSIPNTADGNEFEITEVTDYEENENGFPTKKIGFTANTTLQSIDGEQLGVKNLVGKVAVAYEAK